MQTLNWIEFEKMRAGAAVLSHDEHGDKVLLTPDDRIIKLFRRKRLFSSALLFPYAARFARAAERLRRLGVPTVEVDRVYRIPSIHRHAVVYPRLKGCPLREALEEPGREAELLERLAEFMAMLHGKGVYFRAIHFGNVLVRNDRSFGLIDVSEARFRRSALPPAMRARNFKPVVSYPEDRAALESFGGGRFLRTYLRHAQMPQRAQNAFLAAIAAIHPLWRGAAATTQRDG